MSHIWTKEYDDKLRQRIAELEAERDRLREALQEIERTCISPSHVEKLAQKALEETT